MGVSMPSSVLISSQYRRGTGQPTSIGPSLSVSSSIASTRLMAINAMTATRLLLLPCVSQSLTSFVPSPSLSSASSARRKRKLEYVLTTTELSKLQSEAQQRIASRRCDASSIKNATSVLMSAIPTKPSPSARAPLVLPVQLELPPRVQNAERRSANDRQHGQQQRGALEPHGTAALAAVLVKRLPLVLAAHTLRDAVRLAGEAPVREVLTAGERLELRLELARQRRDAGGRAGRAARLDRVAAARAAQGVQLEALGRSRPLAVGAAPERAAALVVGVSAYRGGGVEGRRGRRD